MANAEALRLVELRDSRIATSESTGGGTLNCTSPHRTILNQAHTAQPPRRATLSDKEHIQPTASDSSKMAPGMTTTRTTPKPSAASLQAAALVGRRAAGFVDYVCTFGCEIITTWLESTTTVWAFIFAASSLSSCGGMARSSAATTTAVGFVRHAADLMFEPKTECVDRLL